MNVNRAGREELLRVPGLGLVTVERLIRRRSKGGRLRRLEDIARPSRLLRKAAGYVSF